MRVRMMQTMAGPEGVSFAGDEPDLPEDLARYLIASRQAEPIALAGAGPVVDDEPPGAETAESQASGPEAGEKAAQKSRGKRG